MDMKEGFGGKPIILELPCEAGTYVVGQALQRSDTDGAQGSVETATTAYTDFVGMCAEPLTAAGTVAAGTVEMLKVEVNPLGIYDLEYDSSDSFACTEGISTTAATITTLENSIEGGWLYAVAGTDHGIYELHYIAASTAGSCTLNESPTVAFTTATYLIKILPPLHQVAKLSASGVCKIGSDVGAGSAVVNILRSYIDINGQGNWELLDVAKHSGRTYNSLTKFKSEVVFRDSFLNPLS